MSLYPGMPFWAHRRFTPAEIGIVMRLRAPARIWKSSPSRYPDSLPDPLNRLSAIPYPGRSPAAMTVENRT